MKTLLPFLLLILSGCTFPRKDRDTSYLDKDLTHITYANGSWQHFLQNLPMTAGDVVTYRGETVGNQSKAAAIVNYDIGTKDLQQCADALIRLRAEYLFARNRYQEIQFQFTNGDLYSFNEYCQGIRPHPAGIGVTFAMSAAPSEYTHQAFRKYLDFVYTYASTISIARELKPANKFEVGTVIVKPGSPGHCFIIVDEAVNSAGEKLYKLVEGFTPAQSMYVLKNNDNNSHWYKLVPGEPIVTSSYSFQQYLIRKFE
jgi:hypothetical protein